MGPDSLPTCGECSTHVDTGKFAMLGRIASQGAYLELIVGLKGTYYGAPCCAVAPATTSGLFFVPPLQGASLSVSIDAK
jgi:hypothetical protein